MKEPNAPGLWFEAEVIESSCLTMSELHELRETPSALSDAIVGQEEDQSPSEICPGCGKSLNAPEVEGDHGEEYCSVHCLNDVYNVQRSESEELSTSPRKGRV